jgi:hypothetical protein
MKRALVTIFGVVALWALGMLALFLWYVPAINFNVVLSLAVGGGLSILFLIGIGLSK